MPATNICKFNQPSDDGENIDVLNFVYEKGVNTRPFFVVQSVFRMHIVMSGKGSLEMLNRRESLQAGDIFVTFPSTEYFINDYGDLEYSYISFVGVYAYTLLERVGINKKDFVRHDMQKLFALWESSLELATDENIDLIAHGVLLYTLGNLYPIKDNNSLSETANIALRLKKLCDDRFTDPQTTLVSLCSEINYNPKYASATFKKHMGVGFSDYLTALRLNNAFRLIENGLTSVKQIAALSGFDDALYFSRCFKKKNGASPTAAIAEAREKLGSE